MIEVLVTKEIDIIQLLAYALSECEDEMLKYIDYSKFLYNSGDKLAQSCLEHLSLMEDNIIWDNADWYYDQIQNALNSETIQKHIKEYFNKIH